VAIKTAIAALEAKVVPQSVKLPLAKAEFPNMKDGNDFYAKLSDNFFVRQPPSPPAASTSRRRNHGSDEANNRRGASLGFGPRARFLLPESSAEGRAGR